MTLKDWIDTLSALKPDLEVVMDDGRYPTKLVSWRGVYAELTLDSRRGSSPPTVAFLLEDAQAANGKTFEGYKGGDYTMGLHTPVWADEWGDYAGRMLLGAKVENGRVVLQTFVRPEEYA
jgi:hypothetical protein